MCTYVIIGLSVGCFVINVKSLTFNDTIIIACYRTFNAWYACLHRRESPVKIFIDLEKVVKILSLYYSSTFSR